MIRTLASAFPGRAHATPAGGWRRAVTVWRRRLGGTGIVALLLVVVAGGIEWLAIAPARQDIEDKEARLRVLGRLAAIDRATLPLSRTAPKRPGLAPESAFPDQLDRLIQHASDQGLQLNDGLYAVTREAQGTIVCYQVTLPVQGSYPQVRRFLAALRAAEPHVALLDVQFKRAKISDPALDAVIRLTYYLRAQP
ncbi:hypothetical protein ACCD08_10845 [Telluria sp. Tellsp104]